MDIQQHNRRLVYLGKYVFSPWTLLPVRTGRRKPYNCVSIDELKDRYDHHVTVSWLDPAEELPGQTIETFGPDESTFLTLPARQLPASFVAVLREGWCHGRHCDWVGIGDRALIECRYHEGPTMSPSHFPFGRLNPRYYRHLLTTPRRFPKPTSVTGRVLVLNKVGSYNYYHWLSEVLPRLELASRAGIRGADAYLVDAYKPFQRQALEALGIPLEKVIEPHNGLLIEADELIVPLFPTTVARRQLSSLLQAGFGIAPRHPSCRSGRRIFISRRMAKKRRLANEKQLKEFLTAHRFEILCLEEYPLSEQIRLLSEASIVIGVHGAGLTNIMHCRPGVQVIEIMEMGYSRNCFPELSHEFGHRHRIVFARRKRPRGSLHLSLPLVDEAVNVAIKECEEGTTRRLAS